MTLSIKRLLLLSSVIIVLVLMILDISMNKVAMFESFVEQFMDEQKTEAFIEAHQGVKKTSEKQLVMKREDIKEVVLSNSRGNISVKRALDNDITLQYSVSVTAEDGHEANQKLQSIEVEEEVNNERLTLASTVDGKSIDTDSISIDYTLLIPDAMMLMIESEVGYVHIQGIQGDVNASSESGIIEIVDVEGNLTVKSYSGSIYLSDIMGNIDLDNQYSDANVEYVKGTIVVNSLSGQNFMSHIDGEITGNVDHGSIHMREIDAPVQLIGLASDIQLDHIRNHIHVTNESGETKLILQETEGYALDVVVSGGYIQSHLPLPIEIVNEDNKFNMNGVVGDGAWNIEARVKSGDIIIH